MLNRLWVAMLTHNTRDAGTDSPTMIIINQYGIDRLHHTFLDTAQRDQEQGEANLYGINVVGPVDPDHLTDSSVRVAIRGDNLWEPEHYVVWGEQPQEPRVVPIAIETDMNMGLSTDRREGHLSLPLRLVDLGSSEMGISRLLMLMTTADVENAGTDDTIELQITDAAGSIIVDYDVPDTPQQDQERAQANFYFVPVGSRFTKNDLNAGSIRLRIQGSDAWLPQSFFLFGLDGAAGRPGSLVPLVHIPNWTLGWMSTDPGEGESSVILPQV